MSKRKIQLILVAIVAVASALLPLLYDGFTSNEVGRKEGILPL